MTHKNRHSKWLLAAAVLPILILVISGRTLWRADQALRDAARSYASAGNLAFSAATVSTVTTADVEWILGSAPYHDAAYLGSDLYLASAIGIDRFDGQGVRVARYLVGKDLPPSRIVRLSVGARPGGGEPILFAATEGAGLLLFDGESFRQILPEDPALAKITAVLPTAAGRILLGTQTQGVLVFDGETLQPLHPSLSGFHVSDLAGTESDLWVGTTDRGAIHWTFGVAHPFTEDDGLPDPRVLSIAADTDSAYVGTALGVSEFRDGRLARTLAEGFFARHLLRDRDNLLVGTLDEGTVEIPLSRKRSRPLRASTRSALHVQGRLLSMAGGIFAVGEGGFFRRDAPTSEWQLAIEPEPSRLTDTNISALNVESDGTLWVGYFDRGLDIVGPEGVATRHLEDDHLFCINRVVRNPGSGATAVATANGLVLFDQNRRLRRVLGREDGLIADHVTDVLLRDDGMTIATPAGLTLVDGGGVRSLYAFQGLVNNHTYTLASANDQLLVGTLGGLSLLRDGLVQASFTTANSELPHNWITAAERVGDEWFVGTYGAGVLRQDPAGRWLGFGDLPGGLEINPNALLVTQGSVYAGTLGNGLFRYDRAAERWSAMTIALPSDNVTALAEHEGYIYVGTENGLVRFREQGDGE